MARPSNDHHVHSDGYFSDKGSRDVERMMAELAADAEALSGVVRATSGDDTDGPYVEIETDSDVQCDEIESVIDDWGCAVSDQGDSWLLIRP